MGITTSCESGGCERCGRGAGKALSREHERGSTDYDYPGKSSPRDPQAAFVDEPLDPTSVDLWDARKEKPSKVTNNESQQVEVHTVIGNGSHKHGEDEKMSLRENADHGTYALEPCTLELELTAESKYDFKSPEKPGLDKIVEDAPKDGAETAEKKRDSMATWKMAGKKVVLMNNMGAKVAIENKIGKKLTGVFRDIALELQRGVAAEGKNQEQPNFQAPEGALFNRCRVACGFTPVRYFATMGLQDGLTEPNLALIGGQDAAGKSGSFFFLSPDQQLIAKSCTKEDWKQLLRILPAYTEFVEAARARANAREAKDREGGYGASVRHSPRAQDGGFDGRSPRTNMVRGFTETLLPRFLGLYQFTTGGDKEATRVLVMANTFGGALSIDRRYDLKGSVHGRKASKKECAKRAPTFKDIDWVFMEPGLSLTAPNRQMLIETIELDLGFLARWGLMDYSLLVGVHNIERDASSVYEAMNVVCVRDETRHCYLGIIDVLTPYGVKKRAETFFMGQIVCGRDISCQHPKVYAKRFFKFVDKQVFGFQKEK